MICRQPPTAYVSVEHNALICDAQYFQNRSVVFSLKPYESSFNDVALGVYPFNGFIPNALCPITNEPLPLVAIVEHTGRPSDELTDVKNFHTHCFCQCSRERRASGTYISIDDDRGRVGNEAMAIPYAAFPIVAIVSMINNKPWIYPRREVKDYGTKNPIEGEFHAGEHVVVLDDTVTTGATLAVAIRKLQERGLQIRDVVLLVDRGEEGIPKLQKQGIHVHAIYHIDDMLEVLCASRKISKKQLASIQHSHEELKESVMGT